MFFACSMIAYSTSACSSCALKREDRSHLSVVESLKATIKPMACGTCVELCRRQHRWQHRRLGVGRFPPRSRMLLVLRLGCSCHMESSLLRCLVP